MDYLKTPQKHMTNQKPKKSNWEVKVNWLLKMHDLYVSNLEEII